MTVDCVPLTLTVQGRKRHEKKNYARSVWTRHNTAKKGWTNSEYRYVFICNATVHQQRLWEDNEEKNHSSAKWLHVVCLTYWNVYRNTYMFRLLIIFWTNLTCTSEIFSSETDNSNCCLQPIQAGQIHWNRWERMFLLSKHFMGSHDKHKEVTKIQHFSN